MKDILLCDLDAFFASVEQRENLNYRGKPLIVGGYSNRSVVSTCSYEARKYGVRSAMPMRQALRLCPHAIVVPVNKELYKKVSEQVFRIYYRFTPDIETVSIDEAYLAVPAGEGLKTARVIRKAVREELNLPVSVGVSQNKLLAKMASEMAKPNGLKCIWPEEVPKVVWPLPVAKLPGVGGKTEKILKAKGILSIGDLARTQEDDLVDLLGTVGRELYNYAHGRDFRQIELKHDPKSIGKEITFDQDVVDPEKLIAILAKLVGEVGYRLRQGKYNCKVVTLKLRRGDFTTFTRSQTLNTETDSDRVIFKTVTDLFKKSNIAPPWRLAGVQVSNLARGFKQSTLFNDQDNGKDELLNSVLDNLRKRYGKAVVQRGIALRFRSL